MREIYSLQCSGAVVACTLANDVEAAFVSYWFSLALGLYLLVSVKMNGVRKAGTGGNVLLNHPISPASVPNNSDIFATIVVDVPIADLRQQRVDPIYTQWRVVDGPENRCGSRRRLESDGLHRVECQVAIRNSLRPIHGKSCIIAALGDGVCSRGWVSSWGSTVTEDRLGLSNGDGTIAAATSGPDAEPIVARRLICSDYHIVALTNS